MTGQSPILLIEAQYFPSLSWFALAARYGRICLESYENYQRQTYRNRCQILGPNKVLSLSVPVQKTAHKIPIREVLVEAGERWRHQHWRSIMSAYGKAPFYEYYSERIHKLIFTEGDNLFDLNLQILSECLEMTGLTIRVDLSAEFVHQAEKSVFKDLRNHIHPKKKPNMHPEVRNVPYLQAFGEVFVQDLSILDLIFNVGPDSGSILKAMTRS